ncbi:MAG TPA: hypothetical protein VHN98_01205 [Acidimicrobiales bacterium]|nr:hypothetical protein [Acidimicrobiales bacterium]
MRRLLLLVASGVLLAILAGSAPAGAIETSSFGIDVASPTKDGRLHVEVRAGHTSTTTIRVWNKDTAAPLTLRLSAVPARVDATGAASLGGDATAVKWVSFAVKEITLKPGERRDVEVRVTAPRKIAADQRTLAVMAEPVIAGAAPAVMQRLAVTTYVVPAHGSLVAGLGWLPWIALIVLLAVAVALGRSWLKPPAGPRVMTATVMAGDQPC